jgi:para-nitrobenzyl esterase
MPADARWQQLLLKVIVVTDPAPTPGRLHDRSFRPQHGSHAEQRRNAMRVRKLACHVVAASITAFSFGVATPSSTQAPACFVQVAQGGVQGVDRGASCAFFGIPFAAPPVVSLRWKPPQPANAWSTTLLANTPPLSCPNLNQPTPAGNEDCLRLNVWARDPLPGGSAPVIVWFHTGSFIAASANFASHNGQRLAEETGVIVVAANYRLGPLGFLAHPALANEDPSFPTTGNYGLLDQQAVLAWVRDNISAFGGDPGNVTIAGTSAGADSVGLHLVAPGSSALFHRAVIESGTPTIRWPSLTDATAQGNAFAEALGCTAPAQVLACLRSKSRDQVLLALPLGAQQVAEPPGRTFWQPVVDGVTIPAQPRVLFSAGEFHHVPTLVGTTRDEAAGTFISRSFPSGLSTDAYEAWAFTEFGVDAAAVLERYPAGDPSPLDALSRLVTDGQFVCEARRLAQLLSHEHTPVFLYSYDYVIDEVFPQRAVHGVESNIIFGNNYVPQQYPNHVLTADDNALHAAMAGYWTRFALSGTPNVDDEAVVHWPAFKAPLGNGRGADKFLIFDGAIRPDKRPREAQCDFWDAFFFRSMLSDRPAGAGD